MLLGQVCYIITFYQVAKATALIYMLAMNILLLILTLTVEYTPNTDEQLKDITPVNLEITVRINYEIRC